MAQSLHILSTSGSALPSDLWVPSTANVAPESAWQVTWLTQKEFSDGWGLKLDLFYKNLQGLITYSDDLPFLPGLIELDPTYWEESIVIGSGQSYGLNIGLSKKTKKLNGQLNYAYTVSERQFEGNNNDESFPFRFTHPHTINTHFNLQLNSSLSLYANWDFGSGQPFTLIATQSRFVPLSNLINGDEEKIGTTNSNRLPDYHRLDIGINWEWSTTKTKQRLNLGIYNVYNRQNPYFQYLQQNSFFPEDDGLKQQNSLPILPSFAYRIGF